MFYTKELKTIFQITEPCLSCKEMYLVEDPNSDEYSTIEKCNAENCPYEKSGCICKKDKYKEGDVCIVDRKRFIHNGVVWILDNTLEN